MKTNKTFIEGQPETIWAMAQVERVFGFKNLDEVKAAVSGKFDEFGCAEIKKGGLAIVATTNRKHWATVKLVWRGVGTLAREAALEYGRTYF